MNFLPIAQNRVSVKKWLAVSISCFIGFLLFRPAFDIGYFSDDYALLSAVYSDEYSFTQPFPAGTGTYFRPLVLFSLFAETKLPVEDPAQVHHTTNISIHILNGILVFLICQLLIKEIVLSLGLGLLFLTHPANITNAYWISGRTDSLMALFYLLSILSFIRYLMTNQKFWLAVTGFTLAGGLLSKETGVMLIVTLGIVYVLTQTLLEDSRFKLTIINNHVVWIAFLGYFLTTLAYLVYVYTHFYSGSGTISLSLKGILEAVVTFPILFLFPNRQTFLIRLYRLNPWLLPLGIGTLVLIAGLVFWIILKKLNQRKFLVLFLSMVLLYLPVLPVVIFRGGISSRTIYLAVAMLSISLAISTMVFPKFKLFSPWLVYGITAVALIFSILDGRAWKENWELTQAYCTDLRAIMADIPSDTEVVLLSVPGSAQNVPLFSNDVNRALFYCVNDQFGYYPNLWWAGNLITDQGDLNKDDIILKFQAQESVRVTLETPKAFFAFREDSKPGDVYSLANSASPIKEILIDSIRDDRRVTAFSINFTNPKDLSNTRLIFFDGKDFIQKEFP